MDQKVRAGVCRSHGGDVVGPDAGVNVAFPVPDVHTTARGPLDVGTQEHVGPEQDLRVVAVVAVDVLDDLDGVRRGAAVVGLGFDLRARVDIHHDDRVGVLALPVA